MYNTTQFPSLEHMQKTISHVKKMSTIRLTTMNTII